MVKIQRIIVSGNKVCIELDNDKKFWLKRKDYAESGLYEHMAINEIDLQKKIQLYQYPHALNQAVSMIARRPCSKKEIETKLTFNRYLPEVSELVLYKLEKEKLINDIEFCDQWIRYRTGQKYGPEKIRKELKQKGVDEEIITAAFNTLEDDDFDHYSIDLACKAWSHIKPGEDKYKSRQKVITSLIRKGYNWDQAKKACEYAELHLK